MSFEQFMTFLVIVFIVIPVLALTYIVGIEVIEVLVGFILTILFLAAVICIPIWIVVQVAKLIGSIFE